MFYNDSYFELLNPYFLYASRLILEKGKIIFKMPFFMQFFLKMINQQKSIHTTMIYSYNNESLEIDLSKIKSLY